MLLDADDSQLVLVDYQIRLMPVNDAAELRHTMEPGVR